MSVVGIVKIGDLKGLGVHSMNDWVDFQKQNPERILGNLAFKLLTKRM